MKYEHMMPAVFQSRPNRFIAYAKIGNLQVTCHVKNTGRCRELLVSFSTIPMPLPWDAKQSIL